MDGILLIDKPRGWTSFDVVAKIRGILRQSQKERLLGVSQTGAVQGYSTSGKGLNSLQLDATQGGSEKRSKSYQQYDARVSELPTQRSAKSSSRVGGFADKQAGAVQRIKVGHTGTLDPTATGLLVLVIGDYTKRAQEFSKLDKTYEVTMKLGFTSTTGDSEGVITPTDNNLYNTRSRIIETKVTEVMKSFVGEISQVPPAYSAIKVNGQRAYKLARAGKEVKLEPRKVTIYEISNIKLLPNGINLTAVKFINGLKEVKFTAKVSSGTYIRTLVEDIGKKLGTGAYMSDLRRTKVGKFDIKDAITTDNISAEIVCNNIQL